MSIVWEMATSALNSTRIKTMAWAAAMTIAAAGVATAQMARQPDDPAILSAIEDEYVIDTEVRLNDIEVTVQDGIVSLTGTVGDLLEKERAEDIAAATVGVRGIVNLLEVDRAYEKTDAELNTDVRDALMNDPATESYEIVVKVNGGTVRLEGSVDSWQERQLAESVAKRVPGVLAVDNALDVSFEADRSSFEIEKEIEERLANDVRVDAALIEVRVDDGNDVHLSGTVGSLSEKRRAVLDAWVTGVDDVHADGLGIEWWARDEMRRWDETASRSDGEIVEAVEDAFIYDPRVRSFDIDVTSSRGAVTLHGTVDNAIARRAAERDAQNVVGVVRVKNRIRVEPERAVADKDLEVQVGNALARNVYVSRLDVDVEVYRGTVYLTGEVNTAFEKRQATLAAQRVPGVEGVMNSLTFEKTWSWRPDRMIRDDVIDQLTWSPFVDADDVDVTVDRGVVTLSGTVNTWNAYSAAEDNAWDGGAKDVVNNLDVQFSLQSHYQAVPWLDPLAY